MRKISKGQSALVLGVLMAGLLPSPLTQTPLTNAETTGPFSDVSASYINEDAITYLKDQKVIQGYPDGQFKPASEINRAEFLKIITASLYPDAQGKNCFPDVKEEWFAAYICTAKEKGLISGYPDGTFKPAETINFSEASKIVANAYNLKAVNASATWFAPYVTALEQKQSIPLSVEFFDEKVTRDTMAEMVYRLKAGVKDKPTRTYEEIVGDDFVTEKSCEALMKRFIEQNAYNDTYSIYDKAELGDAREEDEATMAPAPTKSAEMPTTGGSAGVTANPAPADSSGASNDFSKTNLQVAGVDEADVIKNDGKYIYVIKGNQVRIVEAYPATNLKELVSFTLGVGKGETFTPTEMYVDGEQLTVIGSDYRALPVEEPMPTDKIAAPSSMIYPPYNTNRTKVFVVDIKDRTKPLVTRSVEFDGYYHTSRKVGGSLYMVMNYNYSPIYYYARPMVEDSMSSGITAESGTTMPAGITPESIVPKMLDTKNGSEELVSPCSQIRILPKERYFNYIITAAIPLNDATKDVSRSVIVGNSENIYASQNNLYIAASDWNGGYYRPYGDYNTAVYRFALGAGTVEFKDRGRVPGHLLNQFSMDESSGYFRVATTKNEYVPGSQINNNVYVLNASNMALAGKIENIAPGEKLYSARFMGDRAFLVTFKRIDPFFVLDLSDPRAPRIEGELKVPGYSAYLQPYDEDHILGFGYDVDANKVDPDAEFISYDARLGFKVSMFDVTDLKNPKEMFKDIIGGQGTMSAVTDNHKALLLDKAKNLLAFPVTVYEVPNKEVCSTQTYSTCPTSCQKICVPSSCTIQNGVKVCSTDCDGANSCIDTSFNYGRPVFDGAYVYDISLAGGLKLKGKVTHYNTQEQSDLAKNGYTNYEKTVQRLLYIGENLYSVSYSMVKANALSDMSEKGSATLAGTVYDIYYDKAL